ncbi:MAG: MFS transporter [Bacteroidetes bacterium]|nr:MFS transporter [Bacteroidota bacterium]
MNQNNPRINRVAVSAFFFLHGLCFSTWASRIPNIQQYFHLSDASLGSVLFAMPIGSFITLPFCGWLITKNGSRSMVLLAAVIYCCSLTGIGYASTVVQLVICLFIFGCAGNLMNVAFNTQAIGVEKMYPKPIISSFHGIWSLAALAGASLGGWLMGKNIAVSTHFLSIAIAGFCITIICLRWLLTYDVNQEQKPILFPKPAKSILNFGMIAFCSMMCQGAMFDWSGVYFKKVLVLNPALIGTGYTVYIISMTTTRFFADWAVHKLGLKKILLWSGILTATGLLIAVCFPFLFPALFGFVIVGIGVSAVVPLLFSAVGKSKTLSPAAAIASLATLGFIGLLIGPPLVGYISGAAGLRVSFLVLGLFGLSVSVIASRIRYDN